MELQSAASDYRSQVSVGDGDHHDNVGRGGEGGGRKMNTYRHHLLKNEQNDLVVGESTHQQVVLYLTDWTVAGRTQLVGHSILVHQTLVQSCPTNGRAYQFLIFLLYIA